MICGSDLKNEKLNTFFKTNIIHRLQNRCLRIDVEKLETDEVEIVKIRQQDQKSKFMINSLDELA